MLQFYLLSVLANAVTGLGFSIDYFAGKFASLAQLQALFLNRRFKLALGMVSLVVGFVKLFIPVGGVVIVGDLLPSGVGMAIGLISLSEFFTANTSLPAEGGEHPDTARLSYRTPVGVLAMVTALLHFLVPEAAIL